MKFSLFFLLSILAIASAAIVSPQMQCPSGYDLSETNPSHATSDFNPNMFHYNVAPNDVKAGNPLGPWFKLNTGRWFINGSFHADLTIYGDSARTKRIGTGSLDSDVFFLGIAPKNLSFGSLQLQTNIDATLAAPYYPKSTATAAENRNFKSQTALLGFRARLEATSARGPNTVLYENGDLVLRLWGSSGYVASTDSFSTSGRGTGFDLWATLSCTSSPPIVTTNSCPDNPADSYTLSYAAAQGGQLLEKTSSGNSMSISWSA